MTKTIYRYEVPIDDQWHDLELYGHILHVACRQADRLELWARFGWDKPEKVRLRVFGTGHEIPVASVYRGTALSPGGTFVWHLHQAVDEELYAATTGPAA